MPPGPIPKATIFSASSSRASGQLSTPTKEEIIQGVYLVLLADENIAGEERKRLKDIANSLGIAEIHLGTILEDLAVRLAGRTA